MYAPLIVGIAHGLDEAVVNRQSIWNGTMQILSLVAKSKPGATIAIELTPSRIADFQKGMAEHKTGGTFQADFIFNPIKFRAEQLGLKVVPIDSEVYHGQSLDLERKIIALKGRQSLSDSERQQLEDLEQDLAELVSVKRNRFMLHRVQKLKPDVIIVGQMHAEHIHGRLGLKNRNFFSITDIRPPQAFFEEIERRKLVEQNVQQKRVQRLKKRINW